jgi:putative photosynthetic complex assembly protein 2
MSSHLLAALLVIVSWWAGTAIVLVLAWLKRATLGATLRVSGALALAGVGVIAVTCRETSVGAAVAGFLGALGVWSGHELAFLTGAVTGPRTVACRADARGLTRFALATQAVLHHELALFITAALLTLLSWGAPNTVGRDAFLVLWVMRISAKLNVFLGVRNFAEEFLPQRARYLTTYFRRAPWNPLLPVSVLGGAGGVGWLIARAIADASDSGLALGHTLVATLLALAVVEHVFLALPLPAEAALWRRILRWIDTSRRGAPREHERAAV